MQTLPDCETLLLDLQDSVLTVTLNRPHKRNSMNYKLVCEMLDVFDAIEKRDDIRALVLEGAGGIFCAGGDISDMRLVEGVDNADGRGAPWHFNRSFGRLITRANALPQVVIVLLEGIVLGGGFGLACVSDVAIVDRNTQFALPETGLGIVPAQIAPFVVQRIGLAHARRLALLGERIDGLEAQELGIAHYLTEGRDSMDDRLAKVLAKLKNCAPKANATTKALMLKVGVEEHEGLLDSAADAFTRALEGDEGCEGTKAFKDKRKPTWAR